MEEEDQYKIAFTTPWGTFSYNRMPFGLINVGATFQRAMDLSFGDLKNKIIVVYLDDLTIFSKKRKYHLGDLAKVLQRCRDHDISLNPKKLVFCVTQGKLLGHIVSQGVKIDPDRVRAIQQLSLPLSKIGVKSFFGKVNFLRRFVPNFSEIVKNIVDMMKGNKAFENIKEAIANAPVLVHPDYTKEFIIYCYASEHTMSSILMQENKEGIQAPIAFMSMPLKNQELKYSQIEKHAYAVVKALKFFRFYILHSHSVIHVPDVAVKSVLTQQDVGCNNRGVWIAKVKEYDIDIKPTKLVRGNSLCKAIAEDQ